MVVDKDASSRDFSSLTVLVVDDSDSMRKLLRAMLWTLKIGRLNEVATAADGLKTLQEIPIDLVITDLEMGSVSGLDLVLMIRSGEDSANRQVPIIMLTGYTDLHLVEQARDVGVDEFIAKPVARDTLRDRIIEISDHLRPFVISKAYTGPDRRRHVQPYNGPERRKQPPRPDAQKK